jgi:hypothetical protein
VLSQLGGVPARIVYLFDLEQAYSGHAIIEAHRTGRWGALDPSTAVVYRTPDGQPTSVWALMNNSSLIEARRVARACYTRPEQFRAAGVVNYFCWEATRCDYATSRLNDYYRSILKMSDKGWPGGLRWLHGEDQVAASP